MIINVVFYRAQRAAQKINNQQQGLQIQSGQNVTQTLQLPANGNITKTTNNNINNNNSNVSNKFYRLQNQIVDETSLQRMKDLALITFKNLAPDCNDETNNAFDTSINLFLQSLLKEASSSPQPPQIPIAVSRPDPTPVMVQVKQEPKHKQIKNEEKEGVVDEPIDLNDESHTNGNDDASSDEFASVLIPADETKPAPPLVAVLESLAKYVSLHIRINISRVVGLDMIFHRISFFYYCTKFILMFTIDISCATHRRRTKLKIF